MSDGGDAFRGGWSAGRGEPVSPDQRRCLWCRRSLARDATTAGEGVRALCDTCAATLQSGRREPLSSFIETVDAPILVLAASGRVELANNRARALMGRITDAIEGHQAGEVIECVHASEPGGCGQTEHCSGCTLRSTVQHTHSTGEAHYDVHACQQVSTPGGIRTQWLELSTEKAGELVLLRIAQLGLERQA